MTESLAGGAAATPLSMRAAASLASAAVRAARHVLADADSVEHAFDLCGAIGGAGFLQLQRVALR